MHIRDADAGDLPAILAIYNHAVVHTTAVWNEFTVDIANRADWLAERHSQGFPVLVATAESGEVSGYASYGHWRAWSGYRHTVEHSIYVSERHRGQGIGGALLSALIEHARGARKHVMVAGIEASNAVSLRLHARLGFSRVARFEQVGCKFGRWLDLVFMQLRLDEALEPRD